MDNELSSGRIAVIGERELILGFRLIGMESSIEVTEKNAETEFMKLYHSGKYSLIMASENIKKNIDRRIVDQIEVSTNPLVVFIPMPGGYDEESVGKLAKRILGVDIGT